MNKRGFTLIELLLAVSLMALLAGLLGSVLSNGRRIAAAATAETEHVRKEWLLQETIQSELDLSVSALTMEIQNNRAAGFSFLTYGRPGGKLLRERVRYVFELDPDRPVYHLARYSIADGIGLRESKEILLELIDAPRIDIYSNTAGEFVPVDQTPEMPSMIYITFHLLPSAPRSPDDLKILPFDPFRLVVKNGHIPV